MAALLRGVLSDHAVFVRVGVICHRPHVEAVETLGTEFQQRIAKVTYFGSGDERASNSWHHECDAVIVLGTPRLPTDAVASFLIQCGDISAAMRKPAWEKYQWQGLTESGATRLIDARGYGDLAWRTAHRDLVRSTLMQAVGRGRGILTNGVPVIVFSNEECGLTLTDNDHESRPLSEADSELLRMLDNLAESSDSLSATRRSAESPNRDLLRNVADQKPADAPFVSTARLAIALTKPERTVRETLLRLESRGLVERNGERGGWRRRIATTIPRIAHLAV